MLKSSGSTRRSWAMRSLFVGIIVMSASMPVDAAQAEKHGDAQALIRHRQLIRVSRDNLIGDDQTRPGEDALTKKIEQDKIRLDRVIDICPSC
jgi:hypothetical protein